VVDDDYRETDALRILLKAHLEYYGQFSKKGVRINSVVTSNVTEAENVFGEMGFERIGESEHGTAI
jgi:hypothetical protein